MQRKPYAAQTMGTREMRRAAQRSAEKRTAAAPVNRQLSDRGHQHTEAFCLMWYACECGHRERIWNSRDGVTAFGFQCPSCKEPKLKHVNWSLDEYAPNHVPAPGQRVWIDLTRARALEIAKRTVAQVANGKLPAGADLNRIADAVYNGGMAPDLVVYGYVEAP